VRASPLDRVAFAALLIACAFVGPELIAVASDAAPPALVLDFTSLDGRVRGNGWLVPGVSGQALQLDGIAAHVLVPADSVPRLTGSFTVEGWVALGAYPFNDAPILQQNGAAAGFFLGIGDRGQVRFDVTAGGERLNVVSASRLALRQWTHVAGVFEEGRGITLYVNGESAGAAQGTGAFEQAAGSDLWIGRNADEMEQTGSVGARRQQPTRILLDGILDELKVTPGALSGADIATAYARLRPTTPPPLEARSLPTLPPGPHTFGAVYTRLRYYKGWDDVWRVGDQADVVVRFDQAPYWFTFWRGTSYIPHWVTENGIWYDNEFTETFPPGMVGSAEPMSDKQCRFSQVRILESSEARAVVHWRYAPLGVGYLPAYPDPLTDWADWTDEIHTIYPDGVGVRKIVVHSSKPDADREWHEGIVVMGPGMTPNDAIEPTGVLLANSRGDAVNISWEKTTPPHDPQQPSHAGIQRINTRSRFKPFAIARWQDDPRFDVYSGEVRRDVSIYPWWNHWPTAFEPSNGRYALAADRASHSSLTHMYWKPMARAADTVVKIHLEGMSDAGVPELASLARSWENPARLTIDAAGFSGGEYDPSERAWIIERTAAKSSLAFAVAASPESPVENLAIIVKGWGEGDASLEADGRRLRRGRDLRIGHRQRLEAIDLVVFATIHSTSPIRLVLGEP
jgi:hypothetical protein